MVRFLPVHDQIPHEVPLLVFVVVYFNLNVSPPPTIALAVLDPCLDFRLEPQRCLSRQTSPGGQPGYRQRHTQSPCRGKPFQLPRPV